MGNKAYLTEQYNNIKQRRAFFFLLFSLFFFTGFKHYYYYYLCSQENFIIRHKFVQTSFCLTCLSCEHQSLYRLIGLEKFKSARTHLHAHPHIHLDIIFFLLRFFFLLNEHKVMHGFVVEFLKVFNGVLSRICNELKKRKKKRWNRSMLFWLLPILVLFKFLKISRAKIK